MAGEKKVSGVIHTKSGRVSKPPVKEMTQNCVMAWAAIEKCRDKKKKQAKNNAYNARKKEKNSKNKNQPKKKVNK